MSASHKTIYTDEHLVYRTFDGFLAKLHQAALEEHQYIMVNCHRLKFVDMFAMLGLILIVRTYNVGLTFLLPEGNVRNYLGRVGFFQEIKSLASFEPRIDTVWLEQAKSYYETADVVLGVTPLMMNSIPDMLNQVGIALQSGLGYPKEYAKDICIMLSEMCDNTFEHNSPDVVGYAAMQLYRPPFRENFLQIAVTDNGAGILETLQRNPKYSYLQNDIEAIEKSLQKQVSQFTDSDRGYGLYHLLNLMRKHHGSVTLRSGSGKIYNRWDQHLSNTFDVTPLPGTQIALTFSN